MSDDDRIAYLAGDERPVDPDDRAELDELRTVLADPALWAAPPDQLEDRIAAAIAAERDARPQPLVSPLSPAPGTSPRSVVRRSVRWRTAAVAAAVLVAVGLTVTLTRQPGGGERFALTLTAPTGASGTATGEAHLTRTGSGWRVELDAPGLPRLDDGRFYEAWLRNAAGTLVPIGTFNEGAHVVLWAGVSPRDFPTLTVTEEQADGDQASSGHRVLVGTLALGTSSS